MKVKRFELWIDESGDFKRDSDVSKNPSLVGGVLVERDRLAELDVRNILGGDYVHSNEIKRDIFGDYAIKVLDNISKLGGELIIFENKERLEIVNGSTTYLNIISEGIIQLLQFLSAQYGHIELEILIAVRLNMEKQDYNSGEIIKQDEYIIRLQEKIIMGLARRTLSKNKNWSWSIRLGSARKDLRLMLADVVCNSFLTKNSRKFNDEHREELNKLYKEIYCFTVFEKSTISYIKRLLADGAVGEAIFEIYACDEKIHNKELIDIVLNRLTMLDDEGVRNQLLNIKLRVGTLIKIDNDFRKSKKVLINIQEEFIPLVNKKGINAGVFPLDIYIYLLTVYTHEGSVLLAEQQIDLCELAIKKLTNRWESIDYYFIFKIRQAVHHINTFDFNLAVSSMNEIIVALEETLALLPLVQGVGETYSEIKSDLMGKALGTRLQARNFMIRNHIEQLKAAYKDSDRAINEFMHNSDTTRQYQYRCEIECESGNFIMAVNYLCKSMGILYEDENSLVKLLNIITDKQSNVGLYTIMHYIRIMAEAAIGADEISSTMFKAWNRVKVGNSDLINNPGSDHPYEIIYWKLGTYFSKNGSTTGALKYYNDAINICNSIPERLTLRAIGLGIMAEKASILGSAGMKYTKEFNTAIRDFINTYNQFMKDVLPQAMLNYFVEWKQQIDIISRPVENSKKINILWTLSRKITY